MATPAEPHPLRWMSEARFHRDHLRDGLDHDYGLSWGKHRDQRLSLRMLPGSDRGLLYAYDPLWNEYAVLAASITEAAAAAAFAAVTHRGSPAAVDLSVFTAALAEAMQIEPTQIVGVGAPLALSVNQTATYMRHSPPPSPLAPSIDGSATQREIEL